MIMNEHIDRINAINSLKPNAKFSWLGDVITWLDAEQTEPTTSEIDAEVIRLQAEYDSQAYARNRKAEYDQLNQFEMQFDDDRDSTTTWVDKINEIKGRHPK
jgi:hypothetical protein